MVCIANLIYSLNLMQFIEIEIINNLKVSDLYSMKKIASETKKSLKNKANFLNVNNTHPKK
jgi:hypothetical protein